MPPLFLLFAEFAAKHGGQDTADVEDGINYDGTPVDSFHRFLSERECLKSDSGSHGRRPDVHGVRR